MSRETEPTSPDGNQARPPERGGRGLPVARIVAALAVLAVIVAGVVWLGQRRSGTPTDKASPSPSRSTTGTVAPGPTDGTPTPPVDPAAARPGEIPDVQAVTCPDATVRVATAAQLRTALAAAAPGTVIALADGTYPGKFLGTARGTRESPVWVCGGPGAILDAGDVNSGYGFHLDGATNWRLVGFTVRNAQKGVMLDRSRQVIVQGLSVTEIGDEGIHLRRGTTDSIVADNTISGTGKRKPKFGEGVYVGTAESNWCEISACQPDRSDHNIVWGNHISGTTSENVDIKEGTVGGFVIGNDFDGRGMTDADANVNVKGNAWRISDNKVSSPPKDAFQTHEILTGWGTHNLFESNRVTSKGGDGYVVALRPKLDNVVACSNNGAAGMEVSTADCR